MRPDRSERPTANQRSIENVLGSVILQQTRDAAVVINAKGRVVYANPASERILGFSRNNVVGRSAWNLTRSYLAFQSIRDVWRQLRAGQPWHGTLVVASSSGAGHHIDTSIFLAHVPEVEGGVLYVAVGRDITDTIVLREQLVQAEKMQAIGQFSAGIAHDFKNLLTVMQTSAARLQACQLPNLGDDVGREITTINKSINSGVQLCRSLLGFSRKRSGQVELLDLNDVVSQTIPLIRRLLTDAIVLGVKLAPEHCRTECTVVEIQQVLLNLCSNARDAMPKGGTLSITTEYAKVGDEFTRTHPWARKGRYAAVRVQDTGVGMDAVTRTKVLSPFFTTKSPEKGTGLGLASVYGIAKKHGGMIDIESVPGRGTTVTVYFPAARPVSNQRPGSSRSSKPLTGSAVVAEDQPEIRRLEGALLKGLGLEVFEVPDGMQAWGMLRNIGDSLRLVVSDARMPGMNGIDLYRRLRQTGQRVPFLLCTGEIDGMSGEGNTVADPRFSLIEKPFDNDRFEEVVRDLLRKNAGVSDTTGAGASGKTAGNDSTGGPE